ncbi:MAG TPA: hypothetical protein VK836_11325 [Streptosporangiaceae bacterium]|jgi:hypothetical protein|nr:hypothetical protein [Streptosporangiaceae bacterium]
MPTGRGLDVAALVVWLATESLGAIMLRGWFARGGTLGIRRQPGQREGMSLPILAGHAGLNLIGLLFWILFLLSGARILSFVALGFMAPAIGLGISTVTIWTPYPGGHAQPEERSGVVPDELIERALEDEALGQKLVEELLDRNLGQHPARSGWSLRPLIPASHGVLAIVTFLLATLAAIAAL